MFNSIKPLHSVGLALLALGLALLSCNAPGNQPADQPGLEGASCAASDQLQVEAQITLQETNQFGTRICEYVLRVRNTSPDREVWFYIFQHDRDGYARTEQSDWKGNVQLAPGAQAEWQASVNIYADPDADGPLMSVPEKIAGVFGESGCSEARQNVSYFEQVAIPLKQVCPLQ